MGKDREKYMKEYYKFHNPEFGDDFRAGLCYERDKEERKKSPWGKFVSTATFAKRVKGIDRFR